MKKIIILSLTLIVIVSGCRKDIYESDTTIFVPTSEEVTTNLHGRVISDSGFSLPEVQITIHNRTTFTNGEGYFQMADLSVPNDGFAIRVRDPNNNKIIRRIVPQGETNTYAEIVLNQSNPFKEYSGSMENIIRDSMNQISVTIPENSIVTSNATPYQGTYFARVNYFNPNQISTLKSMPGNLQGIGSDGAKVTLGSVAMFDIEIIDENGENLFLSSERTARVLIPLAIESTFDVPLWRLDETTGLWLQQQNIAERTSNGEIRFLSFEIDALRYWNCDVRELNTYITGTINDTNGIPIENRQLVFNFLSEGNNFYCSGGFTNSKGEFESRVPKDIPLVLSIYDQNCNDIIYTQEVGPFGEESDPININAQINKEAYTLSGFAFDCTGNISYNNASVFLYDSNNNVRVTTQTNEDGAFTIHNICFDINEAYRIGILNLDTGDYTSSDQIPLTEIDLDLGNVIPCDEFPASIRVVSVFEELTINNPSASYVPDSLLISGNSASASVFIYASTGNEGILEVNSIEIKYSDDQVLSCSSQYPHTLCNESVELTITDINESTKTITGNIEGALYYGEVSDPEFTQTSDVFIDFRVIYN